MKKLLEKAIQINEELGAKIEELKKLEPNLLGANGKYFTAKIEDIKCKGRVRVERGTVYLCQDSKQGVSCNDKLGYRYSWWVSNGANKHLTYNGVLDFKLWDYLPKEGEYFYVKAKSTREYTREYIAIAKEGKDITHSYVILNLNSKDLYWSNSACNDNFIVELRPATPQEIAFLDAKLKEKGKYFDQSTMSVKDVVNEPAFKKGDWVLIKKPKDVTQSPYWSCYMNKYDGKTLMTERITSCGYLTIDNWNFHPDWCTKAEVQKSFKEGDWVLITKPKNVRQKPFWLYYMDKYDGQTLEIEEIDSNGYLIIDNLSFNLDWCKKTEAPKSFKVGDRCIFWNKDKSGAVIGTLTGIDNKSDFPYEVVDFLSYKNCIKFESMDQYNKFIEE